MNRKLPEMFDRVRIRHSPQTESLGLAGLTGQVYGQTTPSATGVEVIGEHQGDTALNVAIEGKGNDLWFAPDLIELIDHAAGTEIVIGDKKMVRNANGEWDEPSDNHAPNKASWLSRLFSKFGGGGKVI